MSAGKIVYRASYAGEGIWSLGEMTYDQAADAARKLNDYDAKEREVATLRDQKRRLAYALRDLTHQFSHWSNTKPEGISIKNAFALIAEVEKEKAP